MGHVRRIWDPGSGSLYLTLHTLASGTGRKVWILLCSSLEESYIEFRDTE